MRVACKVVSVARTRMCYSWWCKIQHFATLPPPEQFHKSKQHEWKMRGVLLRRGRGCTDVPGAEVATVQAADRLKLPSLPSCWKAVWNDVGSFPRLCNASKAASEPCATRRDLQQTLQRAWLRQSACDVHVKHTATGVGGCGGQSVQKARFKQHSLVHPADLTRPEGTIELNSGHPAPAGSSVRPRRPKSHLQRRLFAPPAASGCCTF